jgi:hypothetical protein
MMVYLIAARLALRVIPFRWLAGYLSQPPRRPQATFAERRWFGATAYHPLTAQRDEITGAERAQFRRAVHWIMPEAIWFLPGETVCLPQAIAAQTFLRRLGMATTLYLGAATLPTHGLMVHAWLQDGDNIIIGQTVGQNYHVLACFPASPAAQEHSSAAVGLTSF